MSRYNGFVHCPEESVISTFTVYNLNEACMFDVLAKLMSTSTKRGGVFTLKTFTKKNDRCRKENILIF